VCCVRCLSIIVHLSALCAILYIQQVVSTKQENIIVVYVYIVYINNYLSKIIKNDHAFFL